MENRNNLPHSLLGQGSMDTTSKHPDMMLIPECLGMISAT
jgi:hypothetical protein